MGVVALNGVAGAFDREEAALRQRRGEAAADASLAVVLVGLGVTSLSASPSALPAVAARISSLDTANCRRAAEAALAAPDADAARAAVREVL